MKRIVQLTACLMAMLACSAPAGEPQSPAAEHTEGGGPGPLWNSENTETIQGEVLTVEQSPPRQGLGEGVHLRVRTERGTLPVHLGPSWFLEKQQTHIKPQDQVRITGSRVTVRGQETLLAQEVTAGEQVLKLRDANGHPLWAAAPPDRPEESATPSPENQRQRQMAQGQQLRAAQEKMLARMKAMDAELQKKRETMNQAQGQEKVDAMADLLNLLVQQRETMHQQMAQMHQRMMSHMHQMMGVRPGMGAPAAPEESETGPETERPQDTPEETPPHTAPCPEPHTEP